MKVGNQAFFLGHGLKRRRAIRDREIFQERSGKTYSALHLPESIAAVEL
jgi:Mor family transcriptional regulator